MEQSLGGWVAPVLLIPGMALLVISTANRYSQLLLRLVDTPEEGALRQQLLFLRYALVSLYAGIGSLALAVLLGALLSSEAVQVMRALSGIGVGCLLLATVLLVCDVLRDPLPADDQ